MIWKIQTESSKFQRGLKLHGPSSNHLLVTDCFSPGALMTLKRSALNSKIRIDQTGLAS
jgi:hypothetical protein